MRSTLSPSRLSYYFTPSTKEENLSLMEKGRLLSSPESSTSNCFQAASVPARTIQSQSIPFLDFLFQLPPELVGIIHDFLNHLEENGKHWRFVFEAQHFPKTLDAKTDFYLNSIIKSVSSAPGAKNAEWNALVRLAEKIVSESYDSILPTTRTFRTIHDLPSQMRSLLANNLMREEKNQIFTRRDFLITTASRFILDVFLPSLLTSGIASGAAYGLYCSVLAIPHSSAIKFIALLYCILFCGLAAPLCSLCPAAFAYSWKYDDYYNTEFFRKVPKLTSDLSSVGLTEWHAQAMDNAIAHMLQEATPEERVQLNQFLSMLPFWKPVA